VVQDFVYPVRGVRGQGSGGSANPGAELSATKRFATLRENQPLYESGRQAVEAANPLQTKTV
jgi:hypothetical protein